MATYMHSLNAGEWRAGSAVLRGNEPFRIVERVGADLNFRFSRIQAGESSSWRVKFGE
jgi:hypothetical protein